MPGLPIAPIHADLPEFPLLSMCGLRLDWAVEANGACFRLPSADIYPVVRVDSSGTTELVTNYLATDPSWMLGVGKSVAWPKCAQQVQGSDGVLNYIANQKNAIGCVATYSRLTSHLTWPNYRTPCVSTWCFNSCKFSIAYYVHERIHLTVYPQDARRGGAGVKYRCFPVF